MKGGGGPSGCQARGQAVCVCDYENVVGVYLCIYVLQMLTFCRRQRSQMILKSQKFEYELNISHQLHIHFSSLIICQKKKKVKSLLYYVSYTNTFSLLAFYNGSKKYL